MPRAPERLAKRAVSFGPLFQGDLLNASDLDEAFSTYQPEAVIHLAGRIDLRESIERPYIHYQSNVMGSLSLFNMMEKHGIQNLVFSSSASVYAPPERLPIREDDAKGPLNPYGKTKWMIEQALEDFPFHTVSLRYFNAAGASSEGEIGEDHSPETHLIPSLILSAQKKRGPFTLYSSDLNTPDGTAIRDYVHVSDLSAAHVNALDWLKHKPQSEVFNLGTGMGHSILDVIREVERVSGTPIEMVEKKRELKELPVLIADPTKAEKELGWRATHSSLPEIIETAYSWHTAKTLAEV